MIKVLVACEESQATTIAFRSLGYEAFSCDILPCSGGHPEWHADALSLAKTKEERQTLRSKTFKGMANAFAEQWSEYVVKQKDLCKPTQ